MALGCDISVCKSWCCKQFWIDLKEITPDLKKYFELHGCKVKGNRLTIPLRCKWLDKNNRCKHYKDRPGLCRIWYCKDPKNSDIS